VTPRLAISNIAWDATEDGEVYARLRDFGVRGIEVAPTRIAGWDDLDAGRIKAFRDEAARFDLSISSLQAILYNRPEARLLGGDGEFQRLRAHMDLVGRIAAGLGATVAVFGAPTNRSRGEMPEDEARALALVRMRELGDIAGGFGLTVAIEPIPLPYKGDFLTRIDEVAAFVELCAHPFIRSHFDIGCVTLAGDDATQKAVENRGRFVHFHASEPHLAAFDRPVCDHLGVGRALREGSYDGWLVVEMCRQKGDVVSAIETAISYIAGAYGTV